MNKEIVQTGLTFIASGITTWMTARHYYQDDVAKKFETVKTDIKDLRNDMNNKIDHHFDKLDRKQEKFENKVDQRFDKIDQRFDKIDLRFDALIKDIKDDLRAIHLDIKKV